MTVDVGPIVIYTDSMKEVLCQLHAHWNGPYKPQSRMKLLTDRLDKALRYEANHTHSRHCVVTYVTSPNGLRWPDFGPWIAGLPASSTVQTRPI